MGSIRRIIATFTLAAIVIGAATFYFFHEPTLHALSEAAYVPFIVSTEDSSQKSGFDMDILAEVAKRSGFDYDLETMKFADILPALNKNEADIAVNAFTITDAREKAVDFTIPYYHSGLRIMVAAGNQSIKTIEDLEGRVVSTQEGTTSETYLTAHFGNKITLKLFKDTIPVYEAVSSGVVDAAFFDAPNASYYAKTTGQGKVKMTGPLYDAQPYGIAFPPGSKWVDDANQALKSMMNDGTYAKIYEKWFGTLPSAPAG